MKRLTSEQVLNLPEWHDVKITKVTRVDNPGGIAFYEVIYQGGGWLHTQQYSQYGEGTLSITNLCKGMRVWNHQQLKGCTLRIKISPETMDVLLHRKAKKPTRSSWVPDEPA